ncbi:hypothetical protein EZV62_001126 [Acer yangbiense]|uniref:DUF4220 domain-containing protein n=1 Tax=Acer yangbiense TaxID=1000413 RepID=A0A5C7IT80_9ROSI|nr:hypothetical protein EZV62_001126 [Acer yangbiense]
MKRKRMMEVFRPSLRELWKEWELRALVLSSLVVQIIMIVLGNRRRYIPKTWIKCVVWSAYLLADAVATIALGLLLNDLGQIYEKGGKLDPESELKAFWAPFLLLHLGGPDTITAYSLEDNELFLRHAFQLAVQTGATLLIFLLGWNGSRHSFLSMPMIIVGVIKYGERTWSLWSASSDRLRDTMLTPADPGPNYSKLADEYALKHAEGFYVEVEEMKDDQGGIDLSASAAKPTPDVNITTAHALFGTFKRLFADLILSFQDREKSLSIFQSSPHDKAFNVIAIELGFMYDLLYTKASVIYTPWGLISRGITTSLTCLVLVIFSVSDKRKYSKKVDIYVTFLLLVVAIILEIYAALLLLFSDQSKRWLIEHKRTSIVKFINHCSTILVKVPRWSNYMTNYSITCFCLKEKPGHKILKLFRLDKLREKNRYKTYEVVPENLKKSIFKHVGDKYSQFKEKQGTNTSIRDLYAQPVGSVVLKKYNLLDDQEWNNKIEFDQSILIWHIATDLCIDQDSNDTNCKTSKLLSDYMLYLLVMYPFLLPVGIGLIRFRDTESEARSFFEERMSIFSINSTQSHNNQASQDQGTHQSHNDQAPDQDQIIKEYRTQAIKMLLKVKTHVPPIKVKGDRSKSVLFDACRLASALNKISDKKKKWEMIRDVWLEMLTYAACQSRGSQHARHLRRGGELLTHVWLLMSHFGLTEQFQISQGHARAKLTVK